MKSHIKRRIEYSHNALPEEGTEEYAKITGSHQKEIEENPALKKILDDKFKTAIQTLKTQSSNGIGLNMDSEIRHFLTEFNYRSWNHGHRKMPIMFNIMEAFFNLDKSINYWELLSEEDYLISYYDFLDYYTSNNFVFDINSIKENLIEDLIYNYNVGADLDKITFKTEEGKEFVIAGVSLVRRGNEVTLCFLTGEVIDTKQKTAELQEKTNFKPIPGKEKLIVDTDRVHEAVKLNNNPNWWKVLIACRIDLETQTIDSRYIAEDEGSVFSIKTDDITGFLRKGTWIADGLEEMFKKSLKEIEKYSSIFELAKASLYLPYYFNSFEESILEEERDTNLKRLISNPIKKAEYKNVQDRFKLRVKSLWLLNRANIFSFDRIILRDEKFKIETSGYWMELTPEEIGTDKKGRQITGKTWVNRTESYYQAKTDDLIISKVNQTEDFIGENAGYIYIMRNPTFEDNIFKIGLTTKETKERAKQLSKTSVPDEFYVMREWAVKDCKHAEVEIHNQLNQFRVDPRREFFRVEMRVANDVIDKVVKEVNS